MLEKVEKCETVYDEECKKVPFHECKTVQVSLVINEVKVMILGDHGVHDDPRVQDCSGESCPGDQGG